MLCVAPHPELPAVCCTQAVTVNPGSGSKGVACVMVAKDALLPSNVTTVRPNVSNCDTCMKTQTHAHTHTHHREM